MDAYRARVEAKRTELMAKWAEQGARDHEKYKAGEEARKAREQRVAAAKARKAQRIAIAKDRKKRGLKKWKPSREQREAHRTNIVMDKEFDQAIRRAQ